MDIKKLQRAIVDGLEDVKGQNILVFDTEHLSSLFERVIIASGTSNRQTKSLASSVRDAVKQAGFPVPRTEGEVNGEWIIAATDKCRGCREEFRACVCGERVPGSWANTYVMDREAA